MGYRQFTMDRKNLRLAPALLTAVGAVAACTPEIGNDPTPEVLEFDPGAMPPRVSEPSFVVLSRTTGKIDLGLAGVDVPADCRGQSATPEAECEFNKYLESLDGFPTVTAARTPMSAALDPASATVPGNVAVVEGRTRQVLPAVTVGFDPAARYLQIAPTRSWPVGSFLWMGVRGYEAGIRAGGKAVVASVVYNLLKREGTNTLTCGARPTETIDETCAYLALLSQQMSPEAARESLARLEPLRQAMADLRGWELMAEVGGIPKSEVAMLWGFPIHSNPIIDLDPRAGLVPELAAPDEIHLGVNGDLDPSTVKAFRASAESGTVYLANLTALAQMSPAGFPPVTASSSGGTIIIKGAAPFERGQFYGVFVTRGVKSMTGKPLVPPPVSVLLMARGKLVGEDGKSTVSIVSDSDALALEAGRLQLAALLGNPLFTATTGISREDLAYVYAFLLGVP